MTEPRSPQPANVRRAVFGNEPTIRSLRIEALTDTPEAFGSTLARELARTPEDWRRWITYGATFLLETSEGACGLVAGLPHRDDPTTVFLEAMWVRADARGTGAGDALVHAVLDWARELGVAAVHLHVGETNDHARQLYERHGFVATGKVVRERDHLVEVEMRYRIRS